MAGYLLEGGGCLGVETIVMMDFDVIVPNLICFLLGHDLQLYRLVYRNQTRLICRRCRRRGAGTLRDV
jgi:hypothetical protein